MLDLSQTLEFHPLQGSRRGELTAWALAILVGGAVWLIPVVGSAMRVLSLLFMTFFLLSAVFISFGNWVERRTVLQIDKEGIAFRNGLRNVRLLWDEVRGVQVWRGNLSRRVQVLGESARFHFQTVRELRWGGVVRERVGFEQGEQILETILQKAGLKAERRMSDGRYSYLRE